MPVLVTGASGFLGGRLARILAERGEPVRVLARPAADLRHLEGCTYETVRGSLSDTASLAEAVRDATEIYHCAGCSTDWAPWPVFYETNVTGVENLLRAAAGVSGLRRFLHVSTTDIYGYPHEPCDESHSAVDMGLPYNRTKGLGEQRVWEAARAGLPVTVVRPASIYGPRGKAFVVDVAQLLRQGLMAVIDGGRAPAGLCFVDHAAEAILAASTAPQTLGQAYNLADGTGVTWRQYVDALALALGCRRPWISLPSALAFPLARGMESAHTVLHLPGRPLLTRHAVLVLARNQEYPIARARRDFGFAPRFSFEQALALTVQWLREHGL